MCCEILIESESNQKTETLEYLKQTIFNTRICGHVHNIPPILPLPPPPPISPPTSPPSDRKRKNPKIKGGD